MALEEKIEVKIENSDKSSASFFSCKFADKKIKNRAYVNALAAGITAKYLNNNGIKTDDTRNLHYVRKILEEFDIADIELKNVRIDVRAVFDESEIFIPKTHFEYNILPDIYVIIKLKDDDSAEFLGFIEPKIINKNNANREYYFVEKEKLSSISDLIHTIKDFKSSNTMQNLSEGDIEKSRDLMFDMLDNNISEGEKKNLLHNLLKSYELRDNFIELENFETISYSAVNNSEIVRPEIKPAEIVEDVQESLEEDIENLIPEGILPEDILTGETLQEEGLEENSEVENQENLEDLAGDEVLKDESENIIEQEQNPLENIEESFQTEEIVSEDNLESEEIFKDDDIANLFNEPPETEIKNDEIEKDFQEEIHPEISEKNDDLLDTDDLINSIDSLVLGEIEKTSEMDGFIDELNNTLLDDNTEDKITNISPVEDTLNQSFEEIFGSDAVAQPEKEQNTEDNSLLELDMEENSLNLEDENFEVDNLDNSEKINIEDIDINELNFEPEEEIKKDTINIDNIENTSLSQDIETEELDFPQIEKLSVEDFNETEDLNNDIEKETIEETISLDELENIEKPEQTENLGFGTNLLNTLQAEDANISIEDSIDDINLDEIDTLLNMQNDEILTENEENEEKQELEELNISTEDENQDIINQNDTEQAENIEQEKSEEDISLDLGEIDNILGLPEEINDQNSEVSSDSVLDEVDKILNTSEEISDNSEEISDNQESTTEVLISDKEIDFLNETVINDFENSDNIKPDKEETTKEIAEEEITPEADENMDNLEMLFDEELTDDKIPEQYEEINEPSPVPGIALNSNEAGNKKVMLITASIITLAIIGGLGIAISHKKAPDDVTAEQNVPAPISQTVQSDSPARPTEIPQNIPDINSQIPNAVQSKPVQQDSPKVITSENTHKTTNPAGSDAYMSVKSISWQVPDYLSYSDAMRTYLKTAGKSIKISLSSDLLLATEYAYSNQIKINLKISNNGSVQQAAIITSSGSTQIDKIVLQSVKSTLNVVKPPVSVIKTPEFSLTITINL